MKFTQIPLNTFETLQLNAGIFLKNFDPKTGSFKKEDIMGATSGGANFSAVPKFSDLGEDIDNCPKNTMELMNLDEWTITMSGTYKTLSKDIIKGSLGAADIDPDDETHIILRRDLKMDDFINIWWVGDYGKNNGFLAIHMDNVLNTNGFSVQSTDNGKGSISFTYTCHFSQKDVDKLPCDIYVVEASETSGATDDETESGGEPQEQSETYSTGKFDNLFHLPKSDIFNQILFCFCNYIIPHSYTYVNRFNKKELIFNSKNQLVFLYILHNYFLFSKMYRSTASLIIAEVVVPFASTSSLNSATISFGRSARILVYIFFLYLFLTADDVRVFLLGFGSISMLALFSII